MFKSLHLFTYVFLLFMSACIYVGEKTDTPAEVIGLAPIYGSTNWKAIQSLPPQKIVSLGKMYYKNGFIFAGEVGRGIHIIDNRNPSTPKRIKFLKIDGNTDIAIKGDFLYANNVQDLVVLDISDLDKVQLMKRLDNIFPQLDASGLFPENYFGYFECVDTKHGAVIGWEEITLKNPKCWR